IAPTANAGPDQRVSVGFAAVLDGSASFDGGGLPLTYHWTLQARPTNSQAQLAGDVAVAVLTADVPGVYVATLIVSNGVTASPRASVSAPPVAAAGPDQDGRIGTPVLPDGRASSDPEHGALTYQWSLIVRPFASRAALVDTATATPSFAADAGGTYLAQLVVFDGFGYSSPSTVLIVVSNTVNHAPIAGAGADQRVAPLTNVHLDGSGSSDPDGDALKYAWTLTPPPGSGASLDDPFSRTPTFFADLRGVYTAQLAVSDGALTTVDTVRVTANHIPIADAGP